MRGFFTFTVFYALVAVAVLALVRENPGLQLFDAYIRTRDTLSALWRYLPYLAVGLGVMFMLTRQYGGKGMMREAMWALAGCLLFSAAFTLLKTSLPYVIPFYADPFFAEVDRIMHGGVDPWVWTHRFADWINPDGVATLYFVIWGFPAAFFPLILALSDNDAARKRRFLILHCVVWIGLGNLMAYGGASVGPVYYDRLLGTDRFTDLNASLAAIGLVDTHLGMVQDGLWRVYSEHGQVVGSGISAFPSVHNGVATLTMLYLIERSRWLAPVGVLFGAAILFCSVYVGWHYALDGYVSILVITGIWALQRRFDGRWRRNVAFESYKPA